MRDPHACTQPGGKRGRGGRRPLGGAGQQTHSGARETRQGLWPSSLQMMGVALRAGTPHSPASASPSSLEPRGRPWTHSPGTSWGRSLVLAPQEKALWEGPLSPWTGLPAPAPAPHLELLAIPRGWLPGRCPPPVRWQCQGSKTPGPGLRARARPHLIVHCPLSCGLGFLPYSSPQTPDPRSS